VIQRRACGLRDEQNSALKILTCMLSPLEPRVWIVFDLLPIALVSGQAREHALTQPIPFAVDMGAARRALPTCGAPKDSESAQSHFARLLLTGLLPANGFEPKIEGVRSVVSSCGLLASGIGIVVLLEFSGDQCKVAIRSAGTHPRLSSAWCGDDAIIGRQCAR
jgi:hypothetical protein